MPDEENEDQASITYRAWDEDSGTAEDTADVSTAGDTTAFSTDSETSIITVDAVNDTPILYHAYIRHHL